MGVDIKNHNAVIINKSDNVIVSICAISKGDNAVYFVNDEQFSVEVIEDIPMFHKIAITDIKQGSKVIKYGEYIGIASDDILLGQHVHTHNCVSSDDMKGDTLAYVREDQKSIDVKCTRTFKGYKRSDGKVGIRNHVLVLPTSVCATDTCERIAKSVDGCVTFHNQNGCSQVSFDQTLTIDTIAGLAANPNIHSVLAVSLGCENCQNNLVVDAIKKLTDKPIDTMIIQEVGGSIKAVEVGIQKAKALVKLASKCNREECGIDKLILGTNCGGSDPSSGLGSNPLIGEVSDWLIAQGGTSVLCETPELYGGEHVLAKRGINDDVSSNVIKIVKDYEKYVQQFGVEMREGNPSPGNIAGGITTLEEKSLGCIHKAGHSPINNVYLYAQPLKMHEGLVVMDTPGNDASSVGGIIAGGCQLVLFSTGLGTPTGNAIAPVFRITANPQTAKNMADNTDMDCSETIFGPRTMAQLRDSLIEQFIDVCNGKKTKAEEINYTATALPHLCNYM